MCQNLGYDFTGRVVRDARYQSLWAQTTALGCQNAQDVPVPPLPAQDLSVYVSLSGNDATGDGSYAKPYRTVAFAMASVQGATRFLRYVIFVGPGRYDEAQTVLVKANVLVVGSGNQFATRIGARIRLDPLDVAPVSTDIYGWNGQDPRSGFQNLVLAGPSFPEPTPMLFDFGAATFGTKPSNEGKLYFVLCNVNVAPTLLGYSLINQAIFQNCMEFPGHVQTGMNIVYLSCTVIGGGTISVGSSANSGTSFSAYGGGSNGPVLVTWDDSHSAVQVGLYSFPSASLTTVVFGPGMTSGPLVEVTSDSFPLTTSLDPRTFLTLLNNANSVAYSPINPAKWPSIPGFPTPTTVQQALDYLAEALLP